VRIRVDGVLADSDFRVSATVCRHGLDLDALASVIGVHEHRPPRLFPAHLHGGSERRTSSGSLARER
jgi:hypothetical protein